MRLTPRKIVSAALTGAFLVGTALAGTVLVPVGDVGNADAPKVSAPAVVGSLPEALVGEGDELGADEVLVGASKLNIRPTPNEAAGEFWEHDVNKCDTEGNPANGVAVASDTRSPWPEAPGCIYAGGFGVGPSQPLIEFDTTFGLWTRSVAFKRGGKTLVLTLVDGEGYFSRHNYMCPPEKPCGALDLGEQLGAEYGIPPESFVFAATHSHAAPDFIGGWGGVPVWYMGQVAEQMRQSARNALDNMVPATLAAGDTMARPYNSERRDLYYAAEDPSLNWVRAVDRGGLVVATVGTFAAHPTSFGGGENTANADWPVQFAKAIEDRDGGMAVVFQAGLGNMSARGNSHGSMGQGLATVLPAVGDGRLVTSPDISVARATWDHPVTNIPLGALGAAGLFDHPFGGPAAVTAGKSAARPCVTAGAYSATVTATAAKIGGVYITAAPGEVFANFTNTIEEKAPITSLAIGQANDAIGYMPQSFEFDIATQQGTGFSGHEAFGYEEAYSIDRCFGDKTLDETLRLLGTI